MAFSISRAARAAVAARAVAVGINSCGRIPVRRQSTPLRQLGQLTMGFEDIKKWYVLSLLSWEAALGAMGALGHDRLSRCPRLSSPEDLDNESQARPHLRHVAPISVDCVQGTFNLKDKLPILQAKIYPPPPPASSKYLHDVTPRHH
jgi:hypothetical protein